MFPPGRLSRLGLGLLVLAAALAAGLACQQPPSDTPLAVGPLARAEASARAAAKKRRIEAEHAEAQRSRQQAIATWQPSEPRDNSEPTEHAWSAQEDENEEADEEAEEIGSADAGPPLAVADLAGEYLGKDSSVYRLEGLPERREDDPNARTRVEAGDDDALTLVIVDSSSGNDLCAVEAKLKGRVARVEAGQTCFDAENGPVSTTGKVASGKARFPAEGRLILDLQLDFEMRAGDRAFSGKVKYHFDGKRDD